MLATAFVTAYVAFAYFYFWPLGTQSFGRSRQPLWAMLFGVMWGVAQSLFLLSLYALALRNLVSAWHAALAVFVAYSAFAGPWQSRFWDVYVSPEHNMPEWNLRKIAVAHVPFLALSLAHLAAFHNPVLIVAWQTIALVASSLAMHFPSPRGVTDASRV